MSSDLSRFVQMVETSEATRLHYEFRPGNGAPSVFYDVPAIRVLNRVLDLGLAEPDVMAWMEELTPDDVLYDVGANIGLYTTWASAARGARVVAFEPESQNYALICRNIVLNAVQDRAVALCMGVSDRDGLSLLHLPEFTCGRSNNQVGQAVDHNLQPCDMPFRQGCVTMTLDTVVASQEFPPPTRLKIDVDGIEHKIIAGASGLLANPALRSIVIETNTRLPEHAQMLDVIAAAGFRRRPAAASDAQHINPIFDR